MATEKRLIDAHEIEDLFYKQVEYGATDLMDAFDDALQDAQTVDAVEVVHGRWLRTGAENVYGGIEIQCSECGHTFMTSPGHIEEEYFCCNCGAKMDGDMHE